MWLFSGICWPGARRFLVQGITLCFALPVPLCCMCWQGPIWKSIQWLDELGMKAIETVGLLIVGGQQLQARRVHWQVHSASFVTHALESWWCHCVACLQGQPGPFADYLKQYKNTICGRHPIGVLLNVSGPA